MTNLVSLHPCATEADLLWLAWEAPDIIAAVIGDAGSQPDEIRTDAIAAADCAAREAVSGRPTIWRCAKWSPSPWLAGGIGGRKKGRSFS